MFSISYCTTCKNRTWQLKETLSDNLNSIRFEDNVDLLILDYHSDDDLYDFITSNFNDDITSGKLKYFKLINNVEYFDMSYAKNIIHSLSNSDVLFNLDADNFIGNTVAELRVLDESSILIPRMVSGTATGRCGRIGIHRKLFNHVNGYNETIKGLLDDDGDLIRRLLSMNIKLKQSDDLSIPISNTFEQKQVHTNPNKVSANHQIQNIHGVAVVKNINGDVIHTIIK